MDNVFKQLVNFYTTFTENIKAGKLPDNPLYALQRASEFVDKGGTVKCVVLGQDPYPQVGVPTGLAFANKEGTKVLSPSLQVIFDSFDRLSMDDDMIKRNYHTRKDPNPNLEYLADQGVILLNSSLTVVPNKPGSDALMWASAMSHMIFTIVRKYPNLCWIFLGWQAQLYSKKIPEESLVLLDFHPANYARRAVKMPTRVWKQAREWCEKQFGETINWY